MSTAYSIAHGREAEHSAEIKAGLEHMIEGFMARVCGICDGQGAYEQTYTAGCGGGYFKMSGGCDYCAGTGMRQGSDPAPQSVVDQVVASGRVALETRKKVDAHQD